MSGGGSMSLELEGGMVESAWQRMRAVAVCASLVGAAACGGGSGEGTDTTTSGGEVARADSAATATTPGAATSPSSTGSATMSITGGDPEVLQVLAVVDQGEIQDGQLAQRQARNAQVKSFARTLVSEHTKSLQRLRALAKPSNVELMNLGTGTVGATGRDTSRSAAGTAMASPNNVAGQLHTMHMQMMDSVRSMQGAAFDTAFMNAQVRGHQQVLDLLQRAQGQAQNADVQQHLATAVKSVQAHLDRGQQLQQSLMSGGTGTAGDTA